MNVIVVFVVLVGVCVATPQYYIPSGVVYPHPANLLTSALENTLPNELRNDFYKNPRIASRLAQESWFLNKETQVINRETDNIPREKIFNVLHNAGLVRK